MLALVLLKEACDQVEDAWHFGGIVSVQQLKLAQTFAVDFCSLLFLLDIETLTHVALVDIPVLRGGGLLVIFHLSLIRLIGVAVYRPLLEVAIEVKWGQSFKDLLEELGVITEPIFGVVMQVGVF